jgi:hypothetical protein
VGSVVTDTDGGGVCDAAEATEAKDREDCIEDTCEGFPVAAMQAGRVQSMKVDVEEASDGVGEAAGVIVLDVKTVILLLNVVLKPLATELASDKMLLQIAE